MVMEKHKIDVMTGDGVAKATIFGTGRGLTCGVVLYMDAFGPRAALDMIASRIAAHGYVVLLPDLFYRHAPYGPLDARTAFSEEPTAGWLRSTMSATTQARTQADTSAFLDALAAAGATGPVGTVGYCMGGGRALNAAAAHPERIAAAASFHGGNLASDAPDSPHLGASSIKARVYVGMAGVDRSFPPEQSARLAKAMREAELDHTIENYVGMQHGWCVSDHSVYDEVGAERHWKRLLTFFDEALHR